MLKIVSAAALAASAFALAAPAALALTADANVTSISASWQNANPSTVTIDNANAIKTARWGSPATINGLSGYDFEAASVPFTAQVDDQFDLGTFVHQNFPIFETNPASIPGTIDLLVEIEGNLTDAGSTDFAVQSVFSFEHIETPNFPDGPCAELGPQPCRDRVNAVLNLGESTSVDVDGVSYFFSISGFEVGQALFTSFFTDEDASNKATLVGSFTANVNVVPLPAAGWLLIAGAGALYAAGRKRRTDA